MTYVVFNTLHLVGVILLIGNVTVTFIWKLFADRTREPPIVAFAQRLVIWNDWAFTALGAGLIIVSGYGMAATTEMDLIAVDWLFWSQIWFYVAGLIWLLVLVPIQVLQARQARDFAESGKIPSAYWRLTFHWNLWGVLATVLLLAPLYLMVAKI